jgi:hypothetical protein
MASSLGSWLRSRGWCPLETKVPKRNHIISWMIISLGTILEDASRRGISNGKMDFGKPSFPVEGVRIRTREDLIHECSGWIEHGRV